MLYAARECARILLQEGLPKAFARHARASQALVAGLQAMGLKLFGDLRPQDAERHRRAYPARRRRRQGAARAARAASTSRSAPRSARCTARIWRIGTMGYNAREDAVLARSARSRPFFPRSTSRCRAAPRSMPPYRFTAEVVGRAARDALAAGEGEVCAVFRRSFYLRFGKHYACIGDASLGRGPLNALVADFKEPALGDDRQRLDWKMRSSWEPPPLRGTARPQPRGAARLPRRPRAARKAWAARSSACTTRSASMRSRRSRRSTAGSPATRSATRRRSSSASARASRPRATTTSAACWSRCAGSAAARRPIRSGAGSSRVSPSAPARSAPRTSPPRPRGEVHEALHELLDDLSAWEAPDLHPSLARLDAVGHTSGWDALAGIVAVARTAQ